MSVDGRFVNSLVSGSSHGLAADVEATGDVSDPIQDGVCKGWFCSHLCTHDVNEAGSTPEDARHIDVIWASQIETDTVETNFSNYDASAAAASSYLGYIRSCLHSTNA